ncbi:MAG: hypothetical protein HZC04_01780 [Candidatus Lloydbacteria bacterium]|nr:hypothetical protein [Candidatus Lloydbacteria bacterium]
MNINQKTKKIASVVGTSALALFAVYAALVFWVVRTVDKAVFVLGEIAEETHKEENLRLLKNSVQNTEGDRAQIAALFVSEDGIVSFIERVESLGVSSHAQVLLQSVSVEGGVLKLDISATGAFSEVFHFLTLLEKLPYRTVFEKVSILKLPEDKKGNEWQALATFDLLSFNSATGAGDKK